jgi:hypothetical protein
MLKLVTDNTSNVVLFPERRAERATIEMVAVLSPSHSLVETLMAERGLVPHDARTGMAREIAFQARTLQAGYGCDEAIIRLPVLVDAQVTYAVDLCHDYSDAGDCLMHLEYEAAHAERLEPQLQMRLAAARGLLHGRAIAARAAADAAVGAVTALSTYVLEGLAGQPAGKVDPRQLSLSGAAG